MSVANNISEKILDYFSEETKNDISFKIQQAKILLFRKEYDKVIQLTNEIISQNSFSYEPNLLQGHAYFYEKKYKEAERAYIKAIRFKPQEKEFDLELMVKLGNIYIQNQQWYESKVVYKQILRNNVEHSFAWLYLGLSLTKLGEFEEAEKALRQANLLDVEDPLIWAYLTIFCLSTNRKYQALECLNELNKVNFNDISLLNEIGNMFEKINEYEVAANIYKKICSLRKIDSEPYIKIANIYFNHIEGKKKDALEILKNGLDKVMGEKDKKEIEKMIDLIKEEVENGISGDVTHKVINKIENESEGDNDDLNISESQLKNADFLDDEEIENEENVKDEKNEEEEKKDNNDEENKEEEKKEEEKKDEGK